MLNQSFENIMMSIAAFQFLLLGIFLLSNPKVQFHARFLFGIFLIAKGVVISLNILFADSQSLDKDFLTFIRSIYSPVLFVYTPALFLYIRSQVIANYKITKVEWLHFLPTLIFSFTNSMILLSISDIGYALMKYGNWLYYAQALTYSAMSLRLLYSFDVLKGSSDQQHNNAMLKEWLTKLMIMFLSIMLVFLSSYVIFYFQLLSSEAIALIKTLGLFLLFLFGTGVVLQILYKPETLEKIALIVETQKVVNLPRVVNDITEQKLKNLMIEKKPFLELDFNAKLLSKYLDIHPRSLSLLIKHRFKTNFNELVSYYRVQEAKELIKIMKPNSTLAEVQYASGFNSKSVFNDSFNKHANMTPSQFKVLQRGNKEELRRNG